MARNIRSFLGYGRADTDSIFHKFGRSVAVGTTLAPVAIGNIYRTPQVAGATALRVKAGNANDTAAGTGAREMTLIGLDETGAEVTEAVATAGASASSATTTTFIRLYRAYVSKSGTYASADAGSHAADIVIENSAGTEDWATIDSTEFPVSQTEICSYSVPLGKTAFITGATIHADTTKAVHAVLFGRTDILATAAPYSAMRVIRNFVGVEGTTDINFTSPKKFAALTDIGFMADVASGTADVSIDMSILLVDD